MAGGWRGWAWTVAAICKRWRCPGAAARSAIARARYWPFAPSRRKRRKKKIPQKTTVGGGGGGGGGWGGGGVRAAIEPGVSENDLFAIMYHEIIRQGGEFIETRLLTSGQRTNPWFN